MSGTDLPIEDEKLGNKTEPLAVRKGTVATMSRKKCPGVFYNCDKFGQTEQYGTARHQNR